jgi:O-methyltransferase
MSLRKKRAPAPPAQPDVLSTLSDQDAATFAEARPYTMVSDERLVACIDAARYVAQRDIRGAIVECGVWRGGSVLAMIRTLQACGATDRDVYLYDTFEGMTEPTPADRSTTGESAVESWRKSADAGKRIHDWFFRSDVFNLDDTKQRIEGTGYPRERLHIVVGPVEQTIPADAPDEISLLRLDTDWYESTRHELVHLYPRLQPGGALLIDDYGHWDGCRRAVDEYFANEPLLLSRIDYTGRMAVKH